MRISKQKADTAARRLTEKAEKNVEALKKEFAALVAKFYNEQTPKDVHAFAEKHPEFVTYSHYVNFDGHGFSRESIAMEKSVLANVQGYNQAKLVLTAKVADALKKARDKWQDAQKEYKALKEETRVAILNLGTTTKIEKELPIAAQYLDGCAPVTKYPVPAVNLAPLKAKLQKLQKA